MGGRTAIFRQLAKSGTKCFRRASQRPATNEYVLRRFQVGYDPKACVDIAGRVVSRLEQIVLDQDVFAQSFDSSVFRLEWITASPGFGVKIGNRIYRSSRRARLGGMPVDLRKCRAR